MLNLIVNAGGDVLLSSLQPLQAIAQPAPHWAGFSDGTTCWDPHPGNSTLVTTPAADLPNPRRVWKWAGQQLVDQGARPRPADELAAARAARWEQAKATRDRLTSEGGCQAAGKWFHSDDRSRTQQLGLVLLGANVPNGLQWRTMDGSYVTMTQTLAGQILAAAAAQETAIFVHGETLRAAIAASTEPETVDIASGWPATFGG